MEARSPRRYVLAMALATASAPAPASCSGPSVLAMSASTTKSAMSARASMWGTAASAACSVKRASVGGGEICCALPGPNILLQAISTYSVYRAPPTTLSATQYSCGPYCPSVSPCCGCPSSLHTMASHPLLQHSSSGAGGEGGSGSGPGKGPGLGGSGSLPAPSHSWGTLMVTLNQWVLQEGPKESPTWQGLNCCCTTYSNLGWSRPCGALHTSSCTQLPSRLRYKSCCKLTSDHHLSVLKIPSKRWIVMSRVFCRTQWVPCHGSAVDILFLARMLFRE
mmetsp:Transcript_29345/g.74778  ORF Transcript_29345/g.74778 Transcript_29345/m.74778 type:complete len:279 (+) Transcript_29345:329-1165(+)